MSDAPIEGFKALAHPLRFRILSTLVDGEHNVGEIEEASGIVQPTLSQQLAVLRKAELVTTRRDAKQVYYALAQSQIELILVALGRLVDRGGDVEEMSAVSGHGQRTGAAVFARLGR